MGSKLLSSGPLLALALFTSGCKPCERLVNGICYDQPNSENPGLTARWEMIDLETGKPIPDVWISFFWRSFADTKSRGVCARDVIGRTDANGQFNNTAKDGSWLVGLTHYYKPGYYPVRYELFVDQTHITDFHELLGVPKGTYQDWEKKLTAAGYFIDPQRRNVTYRKDFELGTEYQRIFDGIWSPKGLRMYWLKQRGIPNGHESRPITNHCPDHYKAPDHPEERVGYADPKNQREYILKWQGWDAYQVFCDIAWDSVPKIAHKHADAAFALEALRLVEADDLKREALYPNYFDADTLRPNSPARITPEQRRKFCADLQPMTQIGESK